jgi:hypothetical protein
MSFLLDAAVHDYSLKLMTLQLTYLILCLKSIWGAVEDPFFENSRVNKALIVVCIVLKAIVIIALSVTLIRKEEIDRLKEELLVPRKEKSEKEGEGRSRLKDSIWE